MFAGGTAYWLLAFHFLALAIPGGLVLLRHGRSSALDAATLGRRLFRWPRRRPEPFADRLEEDVQRRNSEYADEGRQNHAAEHRGADVAPRQLRGAAGDHQRQETEDEGKRRHHHRPEEQPRAFG